MIERRERRYFWIFVCFGGVLLLAMPFLFSTLRTPLVSAGLGLLLLVVGGWRFRASRHRRHHYLRPPA